MNKLGRALYRTFIDYDNFNDNFYDNFMKLVLFASAIVRLSSYCILTLSIIYVNTSENELKMQAGTFCIKMLL